ncbi:MAG TPA: Rieske 2Fe-2S domain-containing protein [Kofleriaceae bacterium]
MLAADDARTLLAVDAGTSMGELLRRYWMPIVAVSELDDRPIRPVRVLGEDLVLYRTRAGALGLIARYCQHRGFDLAYGTVEEQGLRCSYHGWLYDPAGRCLEQPYESRANPGSTFKDRIRAPSYPVIEKAGLVWAYLGPEPAPLLPDWAGFHTPGYTLIAFAEIGASWVQIMEGFYDPVHIEWLHDRWSYRLSGAEVPPSRPRHTAFRWHDFDYGVVFQRQLEGSDRWLADRTIVFPNVDAAAGQGSYLSWYVPIDDRNTLAVFWLTFTSWNSPRGRVLVPPDPELVQDRIPAYRVTATATPGTELGTHLISQDFVAWMGPGAQVDRTKEHLGESDRGVIMFRKQLFEQARIASQGRDPLGVIRDPAVNQRIMLPGPRANYGKQREGFPGMVGDKDPLVAMFLPFEPPQAIQDELERVMPSLVAGLRPNWWRRRT